MIEPSINKAVITSNVNIVKVTVFTKVKAEQFKCTDDRSNAGGGGAKLLRGSVSGKGCVRAKPLIGSVNIVWC